jgi:hypothetical protein
MRVGRDSYRMDKEKDQDGQKFEDIAQNELDQKN